MYWGYKFYLIATNCTWYIDDTIFLIDQWFRLHFEVVTVDIVLSSMVDSFIQAQRRYCDRLVDCIFSNMFVFMINKNKIFIRERQKKVKITMSRMPAISNFLVYLFSSMKCNLCFEIDNRETSTDWNSKWRAIRDLCGVNN